MRPRPPEAAAPPGAPAAHLPLLDAGRGVAAIAVLIVHLGNEAGIHPIARGYLAVDFFLMLSGFVIARAYEARLARGTIGLAGFAAIRVARLWPVVVAAGLLASASMWAWPVPGWPPGPWLLWQFLLVPGGRWLLFPANAPLWSLYYETIANLAHAAALRRVPTPALALLAGGLAAGAIGYAGVAGDYDVGFRPGETGPALLRIFAGYVTGILLWRLVADGRILPRARPWPLPAALLLGALLMPKAVPEPLAVAIALAAFAAAIVTALGPGPVGRGRWTAAWLGAVSYPLYAVHMPVIKLGFALARPGAPGWARAAGWIALGLVALTVASLVERWWDAPIRARIRAWRRARAG